MKKLILTITLTMAIATASFHAQVMQWISPEETITKDVNLNIVEGSGYNYRVYAQCVAKLQFSIYKFKDNEPDLIWEKEYPEFKLNEISSLIKTFPKALQIPGVTDSKEQIVIVYTIIYQSKGSIMEVRDQMMVPKGTTPSVLNIKI